MCPQSPQTRSLFKNNNVPIPFQSPTGAKQRREMSEGAMENGGEGANPEQYCLKWNDFQANITSTFADLRDEEALLDVSLVVAAGSAAASGDRTGPPRHKVLKAHKLVLCACSPLFRAMLARATHPEPMIFLHGVGASEMSAILTFMYEGQVNVNQEDLAGFLAAAEELRIRGLSDKNNAEQPGSEKRKRPAKSSFGGGGGSAKKNRSHHQQQVDESYGGFEGDYDQGEEAYGNYDEQEHQQTPQRGFRNRIIPATASAPPAEEDYDARPRILGGKRSRPSNTPSEVLPASASASPFPDESKLVNYRPLGGRERDDPLANLVVARTAQGWHCPQCVHVATTKGNLKSHIINGKHKAGGKAHKCDFCLKHYSTRQSLQVHISTHHREERDRNYMMKPHRGVAPTFNYDDREKPPGGKSPNSNSLEPSNEEHRLTNEEVLVKSELDDSSSNYESEPRVLASEVDEDEEDEDETEVMPQPEVEISLE